jgi:hypothetical protein|tara:strand:- start:52 stop:285 length:234 start_codon:yes stop_codon:yes gene_type:complete
MIFRVVIGRSLNLILLYLRQSFGFRGYVYHRTTAHLRLLDNFFDLIDYFCRIGSGFFAAVLGGDDGVVNYLHGLPAN